MARLDWPLLVASMPFFVKLIWKLLQCKCKCKIMTTIINLRPQRKKTDPKDIHRRPQPINGELKKKNWGPKIGLKR